VFCSSRRRHTRCYRDWSSDVCSSDLTLRDSHETLPRVTTPRAELLAIDGTPFERALRAGVGSVMSAFVAYPDWDPSGRAASFSRSEERRVGKEGGRRGRGENANNNGV